MEIRFKDGNLKSQHYIENLLPKKDHIMNNNKYKGIYLNEYKYFLILYYY